MTDWLRRAGHGHLPDGSAVTWSIAEGRRGRRWREVRVGAVGPISSLLLETDPAGRFSHIELSTACGLLTLHPEADGTLHGNVIDSGGVYHVSRLPWEADGLLLLEGSTICEVAAADLLRRTTGAWSSKSRLGVVIPLVLLGLETEPIRVERITATEWRIRGGDRPLRLDDHGLPLLDDGESWPLEE